jgi:hypothetical protein
LLKTDAPSRCDIALRGDTPQEELAAYLHIRQGQLSKIEGE